MGSMEEKRARATIVIPSLDGDRQGRLGELLASLRSQTFQDFEVRLMLLDPRQGRAINRAVRAARGDLIVTMDDDTQLGHSEVLWNLVKALDSDPTIGIAGASTIPGPDSSRFQRAACLQIPRRYFPVTERTVDSDMAQHPCLAMRRAVFEEVGGEDEELVRGLDPLLRHRVRQAGYRVVVIPYTWVSHPLPESGWKIFEMYSRNGRGSAFACRHFRERVYELSDGSPEARFSAQRPRWFRALRYPLRMLGSVLTLRWIKLVAELGYLTGYLSETVRPSRSLEKPPPGQMVTYERPDRLPAGPAARFAESRITAGS
jgi:glycosyltransferase involved in cell wall biosynthesis